MADVVAINFTDRRDAAQTAECHAWIESFDPPKMLIVETSHGQIDPAWLDLSRTVYRPPEFRDAHAHVHDQPQSIISLSSTDILPRPGRHKRIENEGDGQWASGWLFSPEVIFDRDQLLDLLGYVHPIARLKGVFRCQDNWWVINRSKCDTQYHTTVYRRDSRLEIISNHKTAGWPEFESKLLECRSSNHHE